MNNFREYKLKSSDFHGIQTSWDWITDQQIDFLLQLKDGESISLREAAAIYYDAAIRADLSLNHEILELGIVGFTLSRGYRIDILPEIKFCQKN